MDEWIEYSAISLVSLKKHCAQQVQPVQEDFAHSNLSERPLVCPNHLTFNDLGVWTVFELPGLPMKWFAKTPYRPGSPTFRGFPFPCSGSQFGSQRSDGQLLLPVSGNHTDAPVPVPIEGGWGFPQLEQRQQVGLYGSVSSDVDMAVVRKGWSKLGSYKHWPASTGRRSALFLLQSL